MHVVSSGGYYGAERAIVELSAGLTALGWKSLILALESRGTPSIVDQARLHGVETLTIPADSSVFASRNAIGRAVSAHGVDVVHTHGYKGDAIIATMSMRPTVRRVATCHGWITTSARLAVYEGVDKMCLRRFDRIAAVSTRIRDSLRRWGVGMDTVALIENGVDLPMPQADARSRIRAAIGVRPLQHVVLVVGRLDRGKGVADAVRATQRLVATGLDVVLAVAGDGEEREELGRLATSLDIADRVHLLGYRTDVGDLLVAADVFVIASFSEGLPISLIEAMALARPVVATRVGEIENVLEAGRLGRLLNPGDIDALAAAIESVLTRPDEAQRMASAGLRRYQAHFSRAAMTQRYCDLYKALA